MVFIFLGGECMKLRMELDQRSYDIHVERGCISHLSDYFDCQRRYFIITDCGVPLEHIDKVQQQLKQWVTFTIPQGESSKSFTWYQNCIKAMLMEKITRNDCVIAIGGGVVGDLAGFVAATYMRGIDFINIPTTTLAQIDSSIGGKVAIDVDSTKNCVGAFYQPKVVLIDPNVLDTLSDRHYNNGLVEALKTGLIADEELFELFLQNDMKSNIEEILIRSLKVKKHVVEIDEKETGLRKILNFGHTIGHGYESALHLNQLYHGECVGLGMLAILENNEIKDKVRKILAAMNCPTHIEVNNEEVLRFIENDKKSKGNTITIVQVNKIGEAELIDTPITKLSQLLEVGV